MLYLILQGTVILSWDMVIHSWDAVTLSWVLRHYICRKTAESLLHMFTRQGWQFQSCNTSAVIRHGYICGTHTGSEGVLNLSLKV